MPDNNVTRAACHYIDGQWRKSPQRGRSISPSTGELLGEYYDADAHIASEAIGAARRCFDGSDWRYSRERRALALNEMATAIEQHNDELALMLAKENGKIVPEANFELSLVPSKLRYYAALALTDSGRGGETHAGIVSTLLLEPVGVTGVIVPWNSPIVLAVRSFAPALAAGCTAAIKMPAQTALVNTRLAEILASCPSLPPGVLNVFTESGNTGAELLVGSPDIAAISYTGSTAVGRKIMEAAAPTLKCVSLELGGKTPMIVFDDADLDRAVATITAGVTTFTGQFCMTGSRVLAHEQIADELRERLVKSLSEITVGPGEDASSQMGPMIDVASRDRFDMLLDEHLESAEVLVRGGIPDDADLKDGAFYRPALMAVQNVASPLIQRELFGPAATFEVFTDEDDAISRANATEYGLAASVWTNNGSRGLRMSSALEAGTVWINTWGVVLDQFEEGGFKQSGVGRLNGQRALEEFQEIKHVVQTSG